MSLERVEEERNKILDTQLNELFESFKTIIDSSLIETKDKYAVAADKYATETAAGNIIKSAQQILTMVAEVKQALLLNDYQTLNSVIRDKVASLSLETASANDKLKVLKEEIEEMIAEIRRVLLSS